MWIVELALRRPYTFVVAALLIIVLGIVTIGRMPTDVFPEIDIPVVAVVWSYPGISAEEMEKRIVTISERAYTTTVNDIEHMESQSLNGFGIIKIFFHPTAKVEAAVAQLGAQSQSVLRVLPPGLTPPLIIRQNASSVPILQLSVSSKVLAEQVLYDYGLNFIRTQLATVQGASVPLPLGGKPRQVMVDLDPAAMLAKGLSAADVSAAINTQNLILPGGPARMGIREYNVRLNSSPELVDAINDFPIKQVRGATIYVRDVAHVRDGFAVQTNVVRQDGHRSTLITILKNGGASTLEIVDRVKKALPRIQATLPPELNIRYLFDQSLFVRAAVDGVIKEAVIAACLTALMILLFLGSWRSTIIVAVSIPLSILVSIVVLRMLNQTLNVMTLGGMALAVGILVDDATVAIENIHRHLGQGQAVGRAILDGAREIAVPALVSSLAICIVFVPVVFLTGAAKSLFTPLAMAVVFAMLASYVLSRTLVPTMAQYLLPKEAHTYLADGEHEGASRGIFSRIHHTFNQGFNNMRASYHGALAWCLGHRALVIVLFVGFCGGSLALYPLVGEDFFPRVDAGEFRLHVRGPAGTRLEETQRLFSQVEAVIRRVIPQEELAQVLDNIGLPSSGMNLVFSDSATVGPYDGEILVSLNKENHGSTWAYVKRLRAQLPAQFPELTFFFQPSDIVSQILNFGLPAPIDIQITGRNQKGNQALARAIEKRVRRVPGAVDVHLHQVVNAPELLVNVDRVRAGQMGLMQRDIANSTLISLASSSLVAPNYWLNFQNGVNYLIAVQTPIQKVASIEALQGTPMVAPGLKSPELLGNLATLTRRRAVAIVNHYNVQPTFDVYANVQDRDLGGVADDIDSALEAVKDQLPPGSFIAVRGQVEAMRSSYLGLAAGIVFAILLVYFLIVVNFQSWLDPFIILMALPGALAGIVWMLFATQTRISVPALMGAIMSIGLAVANSILLVTFANDRRAAGSDAMTAALEAGYTRLRPVLMTAAAMVIGMIPMALGLGEGGEQNAPLGRAVIGGLLLATVSTLFFVPVVYSVLRRKVPQATD